MIFLPTKPNVGSSVPSVSSRASAMSLSSLVTPANPTSTSLPSGCSTAPYGMSSGADAEIERHRDLAVGAESGIGRAVGQQLHRGEIVVGVGRDSGHEYRAVRRDDELEHFVVEIAAEIERYDHASVAAEIGIEVA